MPVMWPETGSSDGVLQIRYMIPMDPLDASFASDIAKDEIDWLECGSCGNRLHRDGFN